jgi:Bacterial aa3 type cytochrome c oxidase subunit IV
MAVETSSGHPAMDYAEHVRTYQRFIRWTIGMIIFIVLILVFLATLVP